MNLIFRNSTAVKVYNFKFFEKILVTVIKELKLGKKNIGLSVNLVGETKIKELNKRYRNKDRVTDVLSFPMSEKSQIQDSRFKILDSSTDLGDIFICLSFAKNEAKSENISVDRKLAQLTVHGFLHLMGYDHETSRVCAKKMFKIENHIISKIPKL